MGQTEDKKGVISVMAFVNQAFKHGLIVSWPLSNERYDLIVDNGLKMYKIQVKGTSVVDKSYKALSERFKISTTTYNTAYKINASSKGAGSMKTKAYEKNEVDFIVGHIVPLNLFYIVPIEELRGKKGFNVVPNNPLSRNRYNKFCENWKLLCQ